MNKKKKKIFVLYLLVVYPPYLSLLCLVGYFFIINISRAISHIVEYAMNASKSSITQYTFASMVDISVGIKTLIMVSIFMLICEVIIRVINIRHDEKKLE